MFVDAVLGGTSGYIGRFNATRQRWRPAGTWLAASTMIFHPAGVTHCYLNGPHYAEEARITRTELAAKDY